ncbi:MAG: phosphodiester glycosidase family protein [Clostridiales bacterium]|nr:phosphodiester glycosidase family protein [Clostridiales bacterium]
MKKLLVLLLLLMLCVSAAAEPLPPREYSFQGQVKRTYESDTLKFTVERFSYEQTLCYVTKIWMADPGRQIRKATAVWEESLAMPEDMASQVEGAVLAVNGSGYVSPVFPEIPDNYPGGSADYYYTPLGSLTITDGQVFRHLQGVPYYGLTLQQDGLHMHVGENIESILPTEPTQTWSFYEGCPMILDHQSILDESWSFAKARAIRTIIAKMDDNNYILLTVTNEEHYGLSLIQCVALLQERFDPLWAYDLDGGPSSALMCREQDGSWKKIFGGRREDADIMAFTE